MKHFFLAIISLLITDINAYSQNSNDILNLLISNKSISQEQADSLRADAALKQQEAEASRKAFPVSTSRLIQFSGYIQSRYQQLDEKGKTSGFDIRRARLDIRGSVSPYFSYRLQTDFAEKPKIIDAYTEVKLADYLTITAGQFKIPLSMENLTSSNKLEMIDRSQVVEALVARGKDVLGNNNGRDIGLQVSGTILKLKGLPLIEYRLGIFNGSGINVADTANSNKDIAGRLVFTPVKGLSFGAGYYCGWDKVSKPDVAGKSQVRNRLGFEASYITSKISIRSEYLTGQDGNTERKGFYIQGGYYVIPQKVQFLIKYDTYDPSTSKADNISTNYSLGGNLNFNNWTRLQLFYTFRREEGPRINNDYLSIQFQAGF